MLPAPPARRGHPPRRVPAAPVDDPDNPPVAVLPVPPARRGRPRKKPTQPSMITTQAQSSGSESEYQPPVTTITTMTTWTAKETSFKFDTISRTTNEHQLIPIASRHNE